MKKLTYEAPKVQVFGVETQNCFASGGVETQSEIQNMNIEDVAEWDS